MFLANPKSMSCGRLPRGRRRWFQQEVQRTRGRLARNRLRLAVEPLEARVMMAVGNMAALPVPLMFEPNVGQFPAEFDFAAQSVDGLSAVAVDGARVLLSVGSGSTMETLVLEHHGGNSAVDTGGLDPTGGQVNYLLGADESGWLRDVPTYGSLRAADVYPGIDVKYHAADDDSRRLESDYLVEPGADPFLIEFSIGGAEAIVVDGQGRLVVTTPGGQTVVMDSPHTYQHVEGVLATIPSAYRLLADGHVRFDIGVYDSTLPLVIDPVVAWSSFVGGSDTDAVLDVAVAPDGALFAAGFTNSPNFLTDNRLAPAGAGENAFLEKIAPDGRFVYRTVLGGTGFDRATGIAVGPDGNPCLTGWNQYFDDFPGGLVGAGGQRDAFVAKLNETGNNFVFSTRVGGSSSENIQEDGVGDIAVDAAGRIYVSGGTISADFPRVNSPRSQPSGGTDAFVLLFDRVGNLLYSGLIGGESSDVPTGIAVMPSRPNTVVVGGFTSSMNYPRSSNAPEATFRGGPSWGGAFVTELDVTRDAIDFSTTVSGNGITRAYAVAVDLQERIHLAGWSNAPDLVTRNAVQERTDTGSDAFLVTYDPAASTGESSLVFASYLSGNGFDGIYDLTVDDRNFVYGFGFTRSTDLPIKNPLQPQLAGGSDALVVAIQPSGTASPDEMVRMVSYLGGSGDENHVFYGYAGIALDNQNYLYVGGTTTSNYLPGLVPGMQFTPGGGVEGFCAKIELTGSVSGRVGEDRFLDGWLDADDPASWNTIVYLDFDDDRRWDEGIEPHVQTDESGYYVFRDVPPGDYTVRVVTPNFFRQAFPAFDEPGPSEFDLQVQFLDSGLSPSQREQFLLAAERLEQIVLDAATVVIEVAVGPIDGPGGIQAQGGPTDFRTGTVKPLPSRGRVTVDVADLPTLALNPLEVIRFLAEHEMLHVLGFGTLWGSALVQGAATSDPRYIGANGVAQYNQATGQTVTFVPLNPFDGSHWATSLSPEIMMPMVMWVAGGDPISRVTVGSLEDLGYSVDYVAADNWRPGETNLPSFVRPANRVSVEPLDAITGVDFGHYRRVSQSGFAFHDRDNNGRRDFGEEGLRSVTLFVDANFNHQLDDGETTLVTGDDGSYSLTDLLPGTYQVVQLAPPANFVATQEPGPITIPSGAFVVSADFANVAPVTLRGFVLVDQDRDGHVTVSDPGQSGRVVYVDLDGDGTRDAEEPSAVTDSTGAFQMSLMPGEIQLRLDPEPGWLETTPDQGIVTAPSGAQITFTWGVAREPRVEFRLEAVDESGAPLASVAQGETFLVNVFARDTAGQGVFAGYVDVTVPEQMAAIVGAILLSDTYPIDLQGIVHPGELDEAGAVAETVSPLGSDEQLLFSFRVKADAVGRLTITANPADEYVHQTLVYGNDAPISPTEIAYPRISVNVLRRLVAHDDAAEVSEDESVAIDVRANDEANARQDLVVPGFDATSGAGAEISLVEGHLVYDPTRAEALQALQVGQALTDTFQYTVTDGRDTATATVTVTVNGVNDAPEAVNDEGTTTGSVPVVVAVLDNDRDPDEALDPLRVRISDGAARGTVEVTAEGTVRYTPEMDFFGTDQFTYSIADSQGAESEATVTVKVVSAWQNLVQPLDVNADGNIVPRDALIVINDLNDRTARRLSAERSTPFYIDVTGDGFVMALDALRVINFLNGVTPDGEGAGEGEGDAPWTPMLMAEASPRRDGMPQALTDLPRVPPLERLPDSAAKASAAWMNTRTSVSRLASVLGQVGGSCLPVAGPSEPSGGLDILGDLDFEDALQAIAPDVQRAWGPN